MGLDMYFELRKKEKDNSITEYNAFGTFNEGEDNTNYPEDLKEIGEFIKEYNFKYSSITDDGYAYFGVGYFRKFYELHDYIVNKFADGLDRCQDIYIPVDRIQELLDFVASINEDNSESAFISSKKRMMIKQFDLIKKVDFNKYDLVYQASW